MRNYVYIRQLIQELMKCYFQASAGDSCLLFMNQGMTNSVHCVLRVCQFILVYTKKIYAPYAFIYVHHFLHCILLFVSWVSMVFHVFLQRTTRIVLWNIFHIKDRKIPYTTLHQIVLQVFHLEMDVGLCEHTRCSSLWQS